MAQTANVCVSMIPVISGRQDVLQSAVLRDVVRQSVDHAPKTHNNKITLRKEERERKRMSLAGTRHAHTRAECAPEDDDTMALLEMKESILSGGCDQEAQHSAERGAWHRRHQKVPVPPHHHTECRRRRQRLIF